MKAHPYADLFPMMSDAEFAALKDDIAANGLRDPIIIYNDCILDGRNRFKACRELGVKPIMQGFFGKDAVAFVISKNLHRRHLDEQQRALVAAELVKIGRNTSTGVKLTIPEASKAMNIGTSSVDRALKIEKEGVPALKEAVRSGTVSLTQGAAIAGLSKPTQKKRIQSGIKSISPYEKVLKLLDGLTTDELKQIGIKIADLLE